MHMSTQCLRLTRLVPAPRPSALSRTLPHGSRSNAKQPSKLLSTLSSTRRACLATSNISSSSASSSKHPTKPLVRAISTARPAAQRASVAARRPSTKARYSTSTTASSASGSASSVSSKPLSTLTWNEYLALRTKRRRVGLFFSVLCAGATTAAGAATLGSQDSERLGAYSFGMDPIVVLGAATAACGALGWLVGPFIGSGVFSLMYRRVGGAMRDKEAEFYRRIRRNRCDPIGQSVNNPVPDYYGEKITSVRDYRRWLKDQRAFRRKREVNV